MKLPGRFSIKGSKRKPDPRNLASVPDSLGTHLRKLRIGKHVSLEEIAQTTRIPLRTLKLLEKDQFEELPGDVFVRGFLRSYARTIHIDETILLEHYARQNPNPDRSGRISAIAPPTRNRRFGLVIAIVILLVLFTLALSIVLQPRHQNTPYQLSEAPCWLNPNATPSFSEVWTTETQIASSPC